MIIFGFATNIVILLYHQRVQLGKNARSLILFITYLGHCQTLGVLDSSR